MADRMPANLTPEYQTADPCDRRATTDEERLAALLDKDIIEIHA